VRPARRRPRRPERRARIAALLVRAYPRSWRERYGDEVLAWVGEGGLGPARALDLVRGAMDVRLHPELVEKGLIRMVERLRGSVLGVLCGYAVFVVAGAGYQKLTEYEDFTAAANRHAALGATSRTIVVASVVALVAMVVAGAPIGLATVRQALAGRRALWRPLGLVALALLWTAGTLALMAWRARSSPLPPGTMASVSEVAGWLASLLLAVTVGVAAAVTAVRRSELGLGLLRLGTAAVAVVAAAMLVMLGATVWWGLALRSADPALFHSHEGIRASSTVASWASIVALMAASTALALRAGVRGLAANRRPSG
jgi:hypothetical protein